MQLVNQKKPSDQDELEPVLYAALVDSMCQNFWPMMFGTICTFTAALMTLVKTGNDLLWPCVILIIGIGTARAFQMRKHERRTTVLSYEEAKAFEPRYAIGCISYAAVVGLWCVHHDLRQRRRDRAHDRCRGHGRLYRRRRRAQLRAAVVAAASHSFRLRAARRSRSRCMAASIISRSPCCLELFFLALKGINLSLHQIFVKAMTSSFREAALARQFDTALNNMPHGLCMFRADGRLAVMNHRFGEMMGLPDDFVERGVFASDIVDACVLAGAITAASGKIILAEIEDSQARDVITTDPDKSRDRSLSWKFQPMAGGGAVVLLEDITERRAAEAKISHLARYDELTELPNRVNFRDEIERLLKLSHGADQLSALLFIDLDQFKQVNDTLGHPCGDQLLCAVADRLREMLRPEDFVARFGGDEFVVFQQNIRSNEDAAVLARRIVDRLSERYKIDNHLVEIGASVGIAMTAPGITRRHAVEECRHGAVPRQGRRPRHLLLLPRGDWRRRWSRAASSSSICARRSPTRSSSCTSSRWSTSSPARSPPARRCCAGTIRCAAPCRRSTSFRSPRTWD